MKILAGIVTCNREDLLSRCINSLLSQTLKPDLILIVNQGNQLQKIKTNKMILVVNQENHGSAGGWSTAINYSVENFFDFIWLMDDDGYPEINSLELLTNNFRKNYSCLSSVVLQENQSKKLVFSMPIINNKKFTSYFYKFTKLEELEKNSINNLYPFVHLFNGALISSSAIRKIGNINTKLKMYGEEVDYFHRLKSYGKIFTLLTSHHYHPNVQKKFIEDKNIYFLIRNSIINNNKYSKFKYLKNFIVIIITLLRILERNGFRSLVKFIFFNNNLFLKSIYHGFKKI